MAETELSLLSAGKGVVGRLLEMSLIVSSDIRALFLFLSSAFFVCLLRFLFLWASILCEEGETVRGHVWARFTSFYLGNDIQGAYSVPRRLLIGPE